MEEESQSSSDESENELENEEMPRDFGKNIRSVTIARDVVGLGEQLTLSYPYAMFFTNTCCESFKHLIFR